MRIDKIKINLLSETTFGSGASVNGQVDSELSYDKNGMPYLHAKAFKGFYRKAVVETLSSFYDEDKINEVLKSLLGDEGTNLKRKEKRDVSILDNTSTGKLRFSNIEFAPEVYKHIAKEAEILVEEIDESDKTKSEEERIEIIKKKKDREKQVKREIFGIIQNAFTNVRYSTRLEDGVAAEGSLRSERVLKKDLELFANIEILEELTAEEEKIYEYGLKALKHIGYKKSRGRGLVKFELLENKDEKNTNRAPQNLHEYNEKSKSTRFILENLEPLKIATGTTSYDYEESKKYITGSSLRGAFISYLVKRYGSAGDKVESAIKNLIFYDGNPIYYGKEKSYLVYPMINSIKTSKAFNRAKARKGKLYKESKIVDFEDYGKGKLDENAYYSIDYINNSDENSDNHIKALEELKYGLKSSEYFYQNEDSYNMVSVETQEKFHHKAFQEGLDNKENIFRYKSISPNHRFLCEVRFKNFDEDIKRDLENFIESQSIYIGGSKSSGYGKCKVCDIDIKPSEIESKDDRKYLDIYLWSDMSQSGIDQLVGILESRNITEKNRSIKSEIISGFNNKWRSKVPSKEYAKRGSIIRFEYDDSNDIDKSLLISNINNTSFGERVEEGFGRVIANPNFLENTEIKVYQDNSCIIEEETIKSNIEDGKIKDDIDNAIKDRMVLIALKERIDENLFEHVSKTQLNKIYRLLCGENYSITKFNEYLDKMNKSTNIDKKRSVSNIKDLIISRKKDGNDFKLNRLLDNGEVEFLECFDAIIGKNIEAKDILKEIFYYEIRNMKGGDKN